MQASEVGAQLSCCDSRKVEGSVVECLTRAKEVISASLRGGGAMAQW